MSLDMGNVNNMDNVNNMEMFKNGLVRAACKYKENALL